MYDEHAGNASAGQRAKAEREAARVKKQLAKSKMLKELQAEFTDRPEEVEDAFRGAGGDAELARENAERQAYEEEYMTRLTLTKKDKQRRKRALQGSSGNVLDNRAGNGLHDIEDYEALDELINMNAEASGMGGAAAFEDQMRAEKSKRRQKELRRFEQQQRNGVKRISGDADVEYRDPADVARRREDGVQDVLSE